MGGISHCCYPRFRPFVHPQNQCSLLLPCRYAPRFLATRKAMEILFAIYLIFLFPACVFCDPDAWVCNCPRSQYIAANCHSCRKSGIFSFPVHPKLTHGNDRELSAANQTGRGELPGAHYGSDKKIPFFYDAVSLFIICGTVLVDEIGGTGKMQTPAALHPVFSLFTGIRYFDGIRFWSFAVRF